MEKNGLKDSVSSFQTILATTQIEWTQITAPPGMKPKENPPLSPSIRGIPATGGIQNNLGKPPR